jgi:release factor glutamine methyltransferase
VLRVQRLTLAQAAGGDTVRLTRALGLAPDAARREVHALLARALSTNTAYIAAHGDTPLAPPAFARYRHMLERRLAGEPLAYVFGEREFYGMTFEVSQAVLIPRPETELLVEVAVARLPPQVAATVLDLGTGSGCIAVAVATLRPHARVVATDVSQAALEVAATNVARHGAHNVELRLGEGYAAARAERFDLIVSNPPYVAEGDSHLRQGDLRFEPRVALVAGPDGLGVLRAFVQDAPSHLSAGGSILLEHGFDQGQAVQGLLAAAGFTQVSSWRDLAGMRRVAGARKLN